MFLNRKPHLDLYLKHIMARIFVRQLLSVHGKEQDIKMMKSICELFVTVLAMLGELRFPMMKMERLARGIGPQLQRLKPMILAEAILLAAVNPGNRE